MLAEGENMNDLTRQFHSAKYIDDYTAISEKCYKLVFIWS